MAADPSTLPALLDRNVAAAPEATALIDPPDRPDFHAGEPRALTWAELDAAVAKVAGALTGHGLGPGRVLVYQLPNVVELPVLFLAAARLGVLMSPLPLQYGAHEFALTLSQLPRVDAIVTATPFKGRDRMAEVRRLARGAGCAAPVIDVATLLAGPAATRLPDRDPDEILTICWTSGTTGAPKGVPRTHANWIWAAAAMCEAAGCEPGEVLMNPFPAVNHGGIASGLVPWLLLGATAVLHHPLDLPTLLRQIERHRVTTTVAAPAVLAMWLQHPAADDHDLSSLRRIISGSAPLAPATLRVFRERWGIEVVNTLGSNEGTALAADPRDRGDDARRAGRFVLPGTPGARWSQDSEAWLAAPDGSRINAPGVPGELRIKSPGVIAGYLGDHPSPLDADGFLMTGDLFALALDRDGAPTQLTFVGRSKELVIRGGQNIAPAEIEGLLAEVAGVAEAAVVGVPDDVLGERVCACLAEQPGAKVTLDAIREQFASRGVARFKWPERLLVVPQLPRNPMNKVLKSELADLARREATA